jgi:TRAP-type C4-dicarboxylate transport system permease small subunit
VDVVLRVWVAGQLWRARLADERGEGVVSTAIAVLVLAFLGTLMWVGFKAIWGDAQTNTSAQVNQIGS